MVLDRHRAVLDWWLVPLAKAMRNVDPNMVSWIALLAAVTAGICFWRATPQDTWYLVAGAGMVILNGALDVLDGKIATITGQASAKGDYLDHAIDRFADVAILAGLTFSPYVQDWIGLWAIVGTLLTSYLGTQAQAVGIGRNYGGLLGRADRMVLLMVLPVIQYALPQYGPPAGLWGLDSVLDVAMAYFAVVGLITVVQRFVKGYGSFGKDGEVQDLPP